VHPGKIATAVTGFEATLASWISAISCSRVRPEINVKREERLTRWIFVSNWNLEIAIDFKSERGNLRPSPDAFVTAPLSR
jgi:hypothetical protein